MIRAIQVAQYLRTKDLRGEVQLHKLLYYVQGWSLAWTGRQAFVDEIEGWQNGPVVRSLRHVWPDPDARAVPESLAMLVDSVFDFYGQYTSKELIAMTHEESPWLAAWGDRSPKAHGSDEVETAQMLRFFTEQAQVGTGPQKPGPDAPPQDADLELIRAVGAANAQKWKHTLDVLAQ